MARVRSIESREAPLIVRIAHVVARRKTRKLLGRSEVPAPFRVLAHSPAVMQAYGLLEQALWRSRVPLDLRELARAKVSVIVGCPW